MINLPVVAISRQRMDEDETWNKIISSIMVTELAGHLSISIITSDVPQRVYSVHSNRSPLYNSHFLVVLGVHFNNADILLMWYVKAVFLGLAIGNPPLLLWVWLFFHHIKGKVNFKC